MPAKILGFDFGRNTSTTSPRLRPVFEQKQGPVSVRTLGSDSDRRDSMDHFKRPSLGALGKRDSGEKRAKSRDKRDSSSNAVPKHVKLEILAESPPAMFIDDPERSSGALYSCTVKLRVSDTPVVLTSFHLKLEAISSTKKPVHERCPECSTQTQLLKDWNFISENTTFAPGVHEFPASYLIPGRLPATTHGHMASVDYQLSAKAISTKSEVFDFSRPLTITRALKPGNEKNSIRIFPPTNLTLNVTLPSVIHPIGDFNIYARMSGVTTKQEDTQMRWRLRKLTWRIQEQENSISPACSRHAHKVGGEGKGIAHENVRDIGSEELKQGWKSDFEDGQIEGEFTASIDGGLKPNCDVEASNGLKISHVLVLELVIAEEWAPNKKPNQATPTGAARVLRTTFNVSVTERTGMGIAWDDEMPPLYEDVPDSPPAYFYVEDYHGDDLHEDIEDLHLGH